MKEKPETRMGSVPEECYRMEEAFAAQFKLTREHYDYLTAEQKN